MLLGFHTASHGFAAQPHSKRSWQLKNVPSKSTDSVVAWVAV
jgi:hypothetical protein